MRFAPSRTRRILSLGTLSSWLILALCLTLITACGPSPPADNGGDDGTPPGDETVAQARIRPEIHQLSEPQIESFRKGVAEMQARSDADPTDTTGWLYQANMHGFPGDPMGDDPDGKICPITAGGPQSLYATCQHGNFFFLAWHRMYVHFFERILREASGEPELNLPYWDYENPNFRHLPEPFWNPANTDNSLYVAQRAPGWNDGTRAFTPETVSATAALATMPFCNCTSGSCPGCTSGLFDDEAFGSRYTSVPIHDGSGFGALESQPHNVVHTAIGGNLGWMAYVACAARDPIFWLHHANIDRLWQVWLNQGGRVNPINPEENPWTQTPYTFFDVGGTEVTMTACEILNMATQLDYVYEGVPVENVMLCGEGDAEPAAAPPGAGDTPLGRTLAAAERRGLSLGPGKTQLRIDLPSETARAMVSGPLDSSPRYRLVLAGVRLIHPGAHYEIYMNLPAEAEPKPETPYFVGTLALFGHLHAEGDEGATRTFDITEQVRALEEKGEWGGALRLTFVRGGAEFFAASAADEPSEYLTVGEVRVVER